MLRISNSMNGETAAHRIANKAFDKGGALETAFSYNAGFLSRERAMEMNCFLLIEVQVVAAKRVDVAILDALRDILVVPKHDDVIHVSAHSIVAVEFESIAMSQGLDHFRINLLQNDLSKDATNLWTNRNATGLSPIGVLHQFIKSFAERMGFQMLLREFFTR